MKKGLQKVVIRSLQEFSKSFGGRKPAYFEGGRDMKTKIVLALLMVVIGGCYRPHWYRADTTYAALKSDSEWCKTQTNIGATRSEMIDQYEKCMKNKGYRIKDRAEASVEQPRNSKDKDWVAFDTNTKVYIALGTMTSYQFQQYRYFHKKDCKHLWNASIKEVTAGEAIAGGKSKCPDCFR